jgi:hypothetical protein
MTSYVGKIRISDSDPFEVVLREVENPPHDLVYCVGLAVDRADGELIQFFEIDVPSLELTRYGLDPEADQRVWTALVQAARPGVRDVLVELGQLDDEVRPKRGVAVHVPSDLQHAAELLRDIEQLPMPRDLTVVFDL